LLARISGKASGWTRSLAQRPKLAGLALTSLALVLRLPTIDSRPVWYDEAFSVLFSSKGVAAMIEGSRAAEVHPLLYYSLLSGWMSLWGASPSAVRALSLLFGLLTVALAYAIAHRLMSPGQALAAGALVACLPFQVHYAQEARMYSLLTCLLMGTTLAFVMGVQRGAWGAWFAFGVLAAAAMYAHYLALFYLIPLALSALFVRSRRVLLSIAAASLLAVGLFLPWTELLLGQWTRLRQGYWITVPGIEELVRTLLVFGAGLPLPEVVLPVALFLTLLAVAIGLLVTGVAVRQRQPGWERGLWLLGMSGAPVLLMFLVSQLHPVYLERALLPSGAMFALWLGWALVEQPIAPRLRVTAQVGLIGLIAIGLLGFYSYRGFPYAPFETVHRQVAALRQPGEIVLHANKLTALPAAYLDPAQDLHYLVDRPGSGSETLAPSTQRVLGLEADGSVAEAVAGSKGVWLIVFTRELDEYRRLGIDPHPAIAALQVDFQLAEEMVHGELTVQHYRLSGSGSG